ncbi:hypothetical protein MNBD_GAMMA22-1161 [hydrothermal vent metagenome]|uniref:Uncharacterized protein n=1 Tax=hydrothermal vent metagenome TaxID=652676 RepID=A0A3B1APK4_9ZZZZ
MLLSTIENWIIDDMTPKQVRYLQPILPKNAKAKVTDIYGQIRRDFQLVPPITLFSPSSELLAGVWSIWRESQFAVGMIPRVKLEAVSAAISVLNTCPYCVDAHTGMLHAASEHDVVNAIFEQNNSLINDEKTRQIVEWALATRTPNAQILKSPPFTPKEAPEIIGTAIVYHFVNRMVSIFLSPSPLPVPSSSLKLRRVAVRLFGATVAKRIMKRQPISGDSLQFITQAELANEMSWAIPNNNIAKSYASFASLIEQLGKECLPDSVRQVVNQRINLWQGEEMGLSQSWVNELVAELNNDDKPIARLALLTAFAPHQIDKDIIDQFRSKYQGDEILLNVTAWASFTTARHIGRWLCHPNQT